METCYVISIDEYRELGQVFCAKNRFFFHSSKPESDLEQNLIKTCDT
jgi:hypothetical protein